MKARTVFITLWRKNDGDVWNEAGSHPTCEEAVAAAHALEVATDLQTTTIMWVDSVFVVVGR